MVDNYCVLCAIYIMFKVYIFNYISEFLENKNNLETINKLWYNPPTYYFVKL